MNGSQANDWTTCVLFKALWQERDSNPHFPSPQATPPVTGWACFAASFHNITMTTVTALYFFGWCSVCILMVINNEVPPRWANRLDPCATPWSTHTRSRSAALRSLLLFLLLSPAVSFLLTPKRAFDDSIIYIFNYIVCTGYLLWAQVASCLGTSVSAVLLINWW